MPGESGGVSRIEFDRCLRGELAGSDFRQRDIREPHLTDFVVDFDHWAASSREFTDTLADHVDELLLVADDIGRSVDVLGLHELRE